MTLGDFNSGDFSLEDFPYLAWKTTLKRLGEISSLELSSERIPFKSLWLITLSSGCLFRLCLFWENYFLQEHFELYCIVVIENYT